MKGRIEWAPIIKPLAIFLLFIVFLGLLLCVFTRVRATMQLDDEETNGTIMQSRGLSKRAIRDCISLPWSHNFLRNLWGTLKSPSKVTAGRTSFLAKG